MPFGIQPIHLVVIAVVALLIFGPSRLPEIGRGVGKALTEFRHSFREMSDSMMDEVNKPEEGRVILDPLAANKTGTATPVVYACPQCGANNPAQARFCTSCGTKLSE